MKMELVEAKKEVQREAIGAAQPAPAPAAKSSRRPLLILGLIALFVVAVIGGYATLTAGEVDTDDAQVSADLVPVGTRVSGQVIRVAVKENQLVKKGDLIAELDDADYAARVKQAEAELATAQAQAQAADSQVQVTEGGSKGGLSSARAALSGSTVGVGSAAAQVQAARAGLSRSQADLRKATMDLSRAIELKQANAISQERLDNAQVAYDTASAVLAQGKANLAVAEESRRAAEARVSEARGRLIQSSPIDAQIGAARAQADLAHARVKSAEAALDLARLQLSYTKIKAPNDGVASKLTAHEGQLLAMGQPVIELVPTQTYIIANFKETQLGQMKAGQKAKIKVDAFPGRTFEGQVESLSGGTGSSFSLLPADNASGNFVKVVQRVPVRIAWTPPTDVAMRAGLSADVTVEVGR
jgi:membrane fusion protein (multidrug efflux system)